MAHAAGSVRIRLARFGRKHSPVYNIVVAHHKKARDRLPIEVLGMYHPQPAKLSPQDRAAGKLPVKQVSLDFMRLKYWLGTGAQPSQTVEKLLIKAGALPEDWKPPTYVRDPAAGAPPRAGVRPAEPAGEDAPPPVR